VVGCSKHGNEPSGSIKVGSVRTLLHGISLVICKLFLQHKAKMPIADPDDEEQS
jgi:hypothetical protein